MFTPERNTTHTGIRASPVKTVRFELASDEAWLMSCLQDGVPGQRRGTVA
jgi:hypothetical protein